METQPSDLDMDLNLFVAHSIYRHFRFLGPSSSAPFRGYSATDNNLSTTRPTAVGYRYGIIQPANRECYNVLINCHVITCPRSDSRSSLLFSYCIAHDRSLNRICFIFTCRIAHAVAQRSTLSMYIMLLYSGCRRWGSPFTGCCIAPRCCLCQCGF